MGRRPDTLSALSLALALILAWPLSFASLRLNGSVWNTGEPSRPVVTGVGLGQGSVQFDERPVKPSRLFWQVFDDEETDEESSDVLHTPLDLPVAPVFLDFRVSAPPILTQAVLDPPPPIACLGRLRC